MLTRSFIYYRDSFQGLSRDIWLLASIMLINRSGTMVIPFLTVYLTQELDFSFGQAGIVMSFFGLGSILGAYIGGWLTDRIGYYRVQLWSLLMSGAMFFMLLSVESFWGLCGTIFVLSTIADSFRPANMAAIHAYSRPENYTRSLSLIRLAVNLGFAVGPAMGGLLAASLGYSWLFVVDGLTCILGGVAMWSILEEKKDKRPTIGGEEELIPERSPYTDRIYLIFLGCLLITSIAFMQILSTLPVYYKEYYLLSESQIGLLMAMNGGIIALFEMPIVFAIEKRYNLLNLVIAGIVLFGLSYLVLNLGSWVGLAVLSMIVLSVGEIICFPFSSTFAINRSGARNRGQFMGLFAITFSMAHVVAPSLGMGLASGLGFTAMWYVMGGLCAVGALGMYGLKHIVRTEEVRLAEEKVLVQPGSGH